MRHIIALILIAAQIALTQNHFDWDSVYPFMHVADYWMGCGFAYQWSFWQFL